MLSQRHYPVLTDPNIYDEQFYVHDRLGSVRLVVDYNDIDEYVSVANSYTYTPFGQFYGTPDETVDNPFKFTGQWYDAEIAQYYLRARQYDPTMMRFTSRDPIFGKKQEPLTLHKYLYCLNNPIDRIDPSGKISYSEILVSTTIQSGFYGLIGGTLEGLLVEFLEDDENFEWGDVALSAGAGAIFGAITGGTTDYRVLQIMRSQKFKNIAFQIGKGMAAGGVKDLIMSQKGAAKVQAGAFGHALAVNSMAASVWAGWW